MCRSSEGKRKAERNEPRGFLVNMATRKAHSACRNSGSTTPVSVPYHLDTSLDAYCLITFSLCLCTPNGFTWRRYSIILYVRDREKYLHLPDELHRRCPQLNDRLFSFAPLWPLVLLFFRGKERRHGYLHVMCVPLLRDGPWQ